MIQDEMRIHDLRGLLLEANDRIPAEPGWQEKYAKFMSPKIPTMTEREIENILFVAKGEHHLYEESLGHPDEDWATWYATFIYPFTTEPTTKGDNSQFSRFIPPIVVGT